MGWRITEALAEVTGWSRSRIGWTVAAVCVYTLLYPLIGIIGSALGIETLISAIRDGNTALDYAFMFPFWLGLVFAVQTGVVFIILDVLRAPFVLASNSRAGGIGIAHAWVVIAISVAAAVYIPVRSFLDTNTVETVKLTVKIPNLPEGLRGLKIAHISDLQADRFTDGTLIESYINAANALEPDIAVFSGDLITSGTGYIEQGARAIGKINAKYGVYAVLGDHDYWAGPESIVQALKKNGVNVAEDKNVYVKAGAETLLLTLATNIYRKHHDRKKLLTLSNPKPGASIKIFVTHQPSNDIVELAAQGGYDLFLGGHTHGGQVTFPLPYIKLAISMFETSFISGPYRLGAMFININNGLGLTGAPFRYNAPATVTFIELQ